MSKIALLSQETIDKIAAGEVVERPSSVVKELVENAIDAGASAITVEIKEGGISLIRITDNGCGIPKEEVPLAFLRHSTSKIRSAEDLMCVHSLGFRGEALSSIAAVSRVEMITKPADALTGTRYVIEGSKEIADEEIGAPDGTTFLVRDLFYNTPARRKFLKTPQTEAGYISDKLIASSNAIVFSYVLYLIAKYDYKLDAAQLKKCTSKWFFMSTITYFYTGSTESEVEKQFADLRDVHTAAEFIAYIDRVIETHFTDDYFSLTLPNELNSAAAISPAWYGYVAAQIVLNTPMLFSNTPVSKYFILGSSGTKNAIDKHHIFPKNYLTGIGFTSDRDRNQIANFTYLDYATNIEISDKAPQDYVSHYRQKLGEEGYRKTCKEHALPNNFENMEYMEFLNQRRILMAKTVRKAYQRLCE